MIPRLDSFQRGVLNAFFRRESRFFLTGGAALAGQRGSPQQNWVAAASHRS